MSVDNPEIRKDELIEINKQLILQGISGCITSEQVESSTMFAHYLNNVGINNKNYGLFFELLETNNQWIVDGLIGNRDPALLFSSLKPNPYLIKKAFDLLSSWHPGQIYEKVLLAVLGIIQYSYYDSSDGYRIFQFDISDMNNLGKFLNEDFDQFNEVNEILLGILDRMTTLGENSDKRGRIMLSKHAFNIRISFFDNRKNLHNVIPKVLLVKLKREDREVRPSEDFADFCIKSFNQ